MIVVDEGSRSTALRRSRLLKVTIASVKINGSAIIRQSNSFYTPVILPSDVSNLITFRNSLIAETARFSRLPLFLATASVGFTDAIRLISYHIIMRWRGNRLLYSFAWLKLFRKTGRLLAD